jgi:3-oxoacyl-[acyl-carrier-protein] synthase II
MSGGSSRRAVVTGVGVLCPVGLSRDEVADAVAAGRSGIAEIGAFDPSPFRTRFGGEVRGFDPAAHLTAEELDAFDDRYLWLAVAAARQAVRDAGLAWGRGAPAGDRVGVAVGTCNGGLLTAERHYRMLAGLEPDAFDGKMNRNIRYHSAGAAVAAVLGAGGPAFVVSTACSSSTAALGLALELVASGAADQVIAGGSDALCLATMAGFDAIKATSTGRTAPFSLPVGLNLGEGAAFWIVEELESAARRGARIRGELLGYAFTADAHHPTAPDPRGEGAHRTMARALERGGVAVSELGCINLHGTGTEANDLAETKAVRKLVGDHVVPCHSFKSQVGHCLGAAGILEATAGLLAMERGVIPATVNFSAPRPGCDLDCVPNAPRPARYERFLSANYAFGGHNAAIAVGACDPARPPKAGTDPAARPVITGVGAVTPFGLGVGALLAGLRAGRTGLAPFGDRVSPGTKARLAGLVPEFSARDVDRRLDFRSLTRLSRYAIAAARLALTDAGLRLGPREGLETGVLNGVCVGTSEEEYMRVVTRSRGAEADIGGFASIVPNAAGGWVSSALALKGYSCTAAMGADAGLFATALARLAVRSGSTARVLAGGVDELYSQYVLNYDALGHLKSGEAEARCGLDLEIPARRVLAEGAAYAVIEERAVAAARGARILGEIAGAGQTTDAAVELGARRTPEALARAIAQALAAAGWEARDVEIVCWSPQGNRGDASCLEALDLALGARAREVPLVTTALHTGLAEASAGAITLAALLGAWADGCGGWAERTGVPAIDGRAAPRGPGRALCVASSEIGFDVALAIAPEGKGA